ncbi:hypothetical protein EJB05_13196 [Eragrostis curvula]|uniref:Uncharacterized protein n=1 Tax=Eragrostis curvula TaxID=38414 RepID=A0A5J9VVW0_9POAL|nr:hypothetical protein EJB05_13196 [Eragrostis curvula]
MRKANLLELVVQRTQEARQERPNPWSRSRSTPPPMPSSTRASSSTAALWWPTLPPHGRPPTSTAGNNGNIWTDWIAAFVFCLDWRAVIPTVCLESSTPGFMLDLECIKKLF